MSFNQSAHYDVPIPTTRPPPNRSRAQGSVLRRAKTLTRPERGVAQAPLINPPAPTLPSAPGLTSAPRPAADAAQSSGWNSWSIFAHAVTFWAPPFLLNLGGLHDKPTRQAWREKVALCFVAIICAAVVGFGTVGLDRALCSGPLAISTIEFIDFNTTSGTLGIKGLHYDISQSKPVAGAPFYELAKTSGQDITNLFYRNPATEYPSCSGLNFRAASYAACCDPNNATCSDACVLGPLNNNTLGFVQLNLTGWTVGYDWDQVARLKNYMVLDGAVLNLTPYLDVVTKALAKDPVDKAIRELLAIGNASGGKDGTRLFYNRDDLKGVVKCLKERYTAGNIDKVSPGCFISQLVLYSSMVIIMGLVLVRFAMACIFSWFISPNLIVTPKNLSKSGISPAVMPGGANVAVDSKHGEAPWAKNKRLNKIAPPPRSARATSTLMSNDTHAGSLISMAHIGAELFCVCLVTCYSEDEESIKGTLDSISQTSYSDSRKLIFIVADGMITGAGASRSTPDICVGLLDADPRFGNPTPMGYIAVGLGAKAENRAMVYAGHYTVAGRKTPTVIIVKCGTETEMNDPKTKAKAGNRGKRDSQLVLMNFFSRVTYNDRMTPLDFDLFRKIQVLMGVTPDFFEVTLMVDADTRVMKESITQLVNCMHHDKLIMGVCGETRIANKRQSWVTMIQVFEYFISHHLAKAFESVFGGVTCLPGCFSMYRLKVRKVDEDDWVPVLVKPEIIREYSQSDVRTLHQKNLLLLGEDRFLTTCLLRTFPNRKMMFCPQARCRTVAPDTFGVLLSQRRRWINSTVHNLMELVRVRNLCGTFCFSMQFVVFMDLLGTTVLPVAITLTYVLVILLAINPPKTFEQAIPLMCLVAVIGLPPLLILLTTRKIVYVFWMFIYLAALPVWQFILPVYAFWHFDDFSWGETRRVEGEDKGDDHGGGGEAIDTTVALRRWEDWERSRLRKLKREEKRRRDMERQFGGVQTADGEFLRPPRFESMYDGSDTVSIISTDEDQWGGQIGGYNENSTQFPPPPVGVFASEVTLASAETLGKEELEAMLELGWDDKPSMPNSRGLDSPSTPPANSPFRTPSKGSSNVSNGARFQLADAPPAARYDPYVPLQRQFTGNSQASIEAKSPTTGTTFRDGPTAAARGGSQRPTLRTDGYGPLTPGDPGDEVMSPQRNRF
ncbi:chitin synthase-domain-containing protein [Auriculariales sp. MPI-PUGE-AT-0066]|nr:chitin synthase-domain-containing protein [Auriculariales sp. MPI-PUGE-AT-0066]